MNTPWKLKLLLIFSFTVMSVCAHSGDPAKGLEIAKEMKKRDEGWVDTLAETQMILRSPDGRESIRDIRVKTLEILEDGDKSLTIFDQPRDVAGTAFLSFSHPVGPDDQWIYLPAIKRVKRIATRNKSGPFMGSEFAYEDMASFEIEKYTFAYLQDDTFNDIDCFVVEQVPVDKYSGYKRQVAWIDKEHYRVHKIEYYDRKNALLKVLTMDEYEQYENKFWRALRADMENVQTGKSTTLLTSDIVFKTGLDEQDFDKNALRRAR
ncbi:outer membrane lipoprotein-sorting protein [Agaribacter flavus]|uniref:Outer membrane lipoprotein-sorting protein n=1 Tax=Agaribacter flavus TaxID=1902781 RepID=A0ABV7FKJ4_9ALTE